MKKIRKGKKLLLILFIAIVAIITIFVAKKVVDKSKTPETPIEQEQIIALPETTYSGMEVKNIYMEYLKEDGSTMVTMEIKNTTKNKVQKEYFNAILIDQNDEVLGQLPTFIENLEVEEQISISLVYPGDWTATKQIKLEKKQ